MGTSDELARALVARIRRTFDPVPVPPYPPLLGLDPMGVDEYAGFANVAWPDVPIECFRWAGYDIGPTIGFQEAPHMWSYYFPGFMTAGLMHDGTDQVLDAVMWQLRNIAPPMRVQAGTPWWGGDVVHANYSRDQVDCVVAFLQFVSDHGRAGRWNYLWEPADDRVLQRWSAAGR